MALTYGIFGLIPACGAIPAILAVFMGLSSQKASRAAGLDPHGTATVGVVLGWIGIAISLVFIIFTAVNAGG